MPESKDNEMGEGHDGSKDAQENVDPQGTKQPLAEEAKSAGAYKKKQRVLKPCAGCPEPSAS